MMGNGMGGLWERKKSSNFAADFRVESLAIAVGGLTVR